ncbi:PAS/PAC and GAF sensor-containing diguanylate cyclase/phosphodiesterase [Stappia sp. 22II-S9-Z10]|nr:PAS/PAC and GAF sensor-containing diguanylate cyclase/phosphodiesterase [Stappia sp. 22II-S9-Z10]
MIADATARYGAVPESEIGRIPLDDTPWLGLCDRRYEDDPILLMRAEDEDGDKARALLSAETVFDLLRESKKLNEEMQGLDERDHVLTAAANDAVDNISGIGFWQLEIATGRLTLSDDAYRIHGLAPGQRLTMDDAIAFYEPDVREIVRSNLKRAKEHRAGYSYVLPMLRADGQRRIVRSIGYVALKDNGSDTVYGIVQDVTEERETQVRLWSAANIDSLTSVPNRFHWQQRIDHDIAAAARNQRSVGLMLVDLDHFKTINDVHGHEAGDEALRAVARTLSANLRGGDLLARLGGDEFAIVIPDLGNADELHNLVERFANVRNVAFEYRGMPMTVNLSIGAAAFPSDADSSGELYRAADMALFHAKSDRSLGATRYDTALQREHEGRSERRKRIRRALKAGAFVNLYQPIVDVKTGAVVAMDVAARWRDEERLADLSLIGEEEEQSLLPQVGAAVVELMVRDLESLAAGCDRLPVCILPLRSAHLHAAEVLDGLDEARAILSRSGGRLRLQLDGDPRPSLTWPLRTRFLDLLSSGVGVVQRAQQAAGALLSPGSLPLRHVKLPLDAIRSAETGAGDLVLRALIEAARQRGLMVSALAVATSLDVQRVAAYDVRYAQGTHFGDAMPLERFKERLLAAPAASHSLAG